MYSNIAAVMESIRVQPYSPLANEMTKFFQNIIDYKEDLKKKGTAGKQLNESVVSNFSSNRRVLSKIIEKHCGLIVNTFNVAPGPCGMFAVDLSMGNATQVIRTMEQYTGVRLGDTSERASDNFKDITNAVDLEKSFLTKQTYGKNKTLISVDMYFDPYIAFLSKEAIHKELPELEAREIAGIICHEIGHAFVLIERAAHEYMTLTRINNFIKPMNKDELKDPKFLKERIEAVKVLAKEVENNSDLPAYHKTAIRKSAQAGEYLFKTMLDNPIMGVFLTAIALVVNMALIVLIGTPVCIQTNSIVRELEDLKTRWYEQDGKTGDLKFSRKNLTLNERLADEFAARHGFGGDLAEGLVKLGDTLRFLHSTLTISVGNTGLRNSKLFFKLASIMKLRVAIFEFISPDSIYEGDVFRIKRLMEDNLVALSDNLPREARDHYITQYEKSLKAMGKVGKLSKAKESIYKAIGNFTFTTQVLGMLKDGKLPKELEILADSTEAIIANKIQYYAAKLDQLKRNA
jgi:hypothetical protein